MNATFRLCFCLLLFLLAESWYFKSRVLQSVLALICQRLFMQCFHFGSESLRSVSFVMNSEWICILNTVLLKLNCGTCCLCLQMLISVDVEGRSSNFMDTELEDEEVPSMQFFLVLFSILKTQLLLFSVDYIFEHHISFPVLFIHDNRVAVMNGKSVWAL